MQTHFKFLCMACTVLLCYSCGGNNPQTTSGYSEYEKPDTTNSVQEMKDYHYSAEVKVGQTRYTYDIVREVNDTLPLVTGDDGERYADNYIRLRVNREGKEIFNKVFTKNHFRSYMEKGFISHAILEGMAFDKADGNNLRFATSVSYPASDIYIPLSITISPDGSYQITKDEVLDTVVATDSTETEEYSDKPRCPVQVSLGRASWLFPLNKRRERYFINFSNCNFNFGSEGRFA